MLLLHTLSAPDGPRGCIDDAPQEHPRFSRALRAFAIGPTHFTAFSGEAKPKMADAARLCPIVQYCAQHLHGHMNRFLQQHANLPILKYPQEVPGPCRFSLLLPHAAAMNVCVMTTKSDVLAIT